ncbi:MAG: aminopeptidase P family protein [Planctomycetes bacterium]|nr:aminopeptidase P family protein [Planctomycetota bacterium]
MRHAPIDAALFCVNRDRLRALLPPRSVVVVHAADVLPTNGDGTLRLAPAADLFWLTGIEQEESVLVLAPDAIDPAQRQILFIRQPNELLATWEGEKLSKEKATAISAIAKVRWLTELPTVLHGLLCDCDRVWIDSNEHERSSTEIEPRDLRLARDLMHRYPLHRYERLQPVMRGLRAAKSDIEIDLVRQAIDITAAGLSRVLAALRPGVMEYELEAELVGEFTRRRARMAYEPIIGSGKNACVLHYLDNDQECRSGDLVLIDVGANYGNYAADLTRTYPVSGRFTARQRAVYDAVKRVFDRAVARTTVGTRIRDWKRAAQIDMADELVGLGLITAEERAGDSAEEPACRRYFMHGLGHSLGLGVHDLAPQDGPLAAGWIMTVEPGLYIPEEGIGVRLENDILVTEQGPIDLCSHVPMDADEIERLLAAR